MNAFKTAITEIWEDIRGEIVKNRHALPRKALGFGIIAYIAIFLFLGLFGLKHIHSVWVFLFQVLMMSIALSTLFFLYHIGAFLMKDGD